MTKPSATSGRNIHRGRMRNGPGGAGHTTRSLTHASSRTRRRASAMLDEAAQTYVTHCPCPADHHALIEARVGDRFDCWTWVGKIDRDGYGAVTHGGRMWRAHRLSYATFVAPVPAGLVLDHLCRNRACVRPDHLDPVTNLENLRRGIGPASRQRRRVSFVPLALDDPRHGMAGTYTNLQCRCPRCRAANTARCVAYQQRKRAERAAR